MSIYRPNSQTQQALRRQKTALTARLRENMRLKLVSLAAAVCLYVFVQADHNPAISRDLNVEVQYRHVPPNADVDAAQRRVTLTVIGPRSLVDSIKDSDVHVVASFLNRSLSVNKVQTLSQFTPVFSRLSQDQINQLSIDQTGAVFRFRLIGFVTRSKSVSLQLKPPPTGFHYDKPVIKPAEIALSGREDRVDLVEKAVIDYKASEDGRIKGAFPVTLRDHDEAVVENVAASPATVNVSVSLLPDALVRVVTVSADIRETPLPPYSFTYHVEPGRVKITGNAEAVNRTFTLLTDEISLRNETQNRDIMANLVIPDGLAVQDMQGNALKKVKVHVVMLKTMTTPVKPVTQPVFPPQLPPVDPNG